MIILVLYESNAAIYPTTDLHTKSIVNNGWK